MLFLNSFFTKKSITLFLGIISLFSLGFISGTNFSFSNYPVLTLISFAGYYFILNKFFFDSIQEASISSYMFGFGFFSFSHSWISSPLDMFGDLYAVFKPYVFVIVPMILACFYGLSGFLLYKIKDKKQNWRRVLVLAFLTVLYEYIRCEYIPAVPLGQIGGIWITSPHVLQTVSLIGIYGLSFLTVFVSYSIGEFFLSRSIQGLMASLLLTVMIFSFGHFRLRNTELKIRSEKVKIIPTSWMHSEKNKEMDQRVKHLKECCERLSQDAVDLIVFPETVLEFSLMEKDDKFVFHFPEISSYIVDQLPNKSIVLFGLTKRSGNGKILFNSMCGLDKKGIFYSYDKRFLAPFGEFRPYGLQTIMDWLRVYALDDFQRGKRYQPLMKINNNFWVQPAICYEGSYTQKIISAEELRPDLLVVMTNDSWFHANGKEQQCLSHVLRAVEICITSWRL
jgi:apolipoprotein N-acyltransferase